MTTLTNDGLFAVAERLGVQTLPVALAVAPQHDSHDEWREAQEEAITGLTAAGLLDSYGDVNPELAQALYVLAQPERELAMRVFRSSEDPDAPADIVRISLTMRGNDHALAVRTGDEFDVQTIWSDGSATSLARPLLGVLGSCPAAEITEFSAHSQELSERLDQATTAADYADACFALGVQGHDATVLGLAFETCHAYAEIVAYDHDEGITTRTPGAIAVYDTGRGRIVVTPSVAPDLTPWSTVTPGTDQRIAQAISALVELLPGGRWLRQ